MEKCLLFEKLEASLAYCSVSYDDQLPGDDQLFVGFTVCHFLCKNTIAMALATLVRAFIHMTHSGLQT